MAFTMDTAWLLICSLLFLDSCVWLIHWNTVLSTFEHETFVVLFCWFINMLIAFWVCSCGLHCHEPVIWCMMTRICILETADQWLLLWLFETKIWLCDLGLPHAIAFLASLLRRHCQIWVQSHAITFLASLLCWIRQRNLLLWSMVLAVFLDEWMVEWKELLLSFLHVTATIHSWCTHCVVEDYTSFSVSFDL